MKGACDRAGLLSAIILPRALELQKLLLKAREGRSALSLCYTCVVCLHLAAAEAGEDVSLQQLVRQSGMHCSPPSTATSHYLQTYHEVATLIKVNPTKMENPRKDEDVAREFRAFILDIWTKINEDDKFLMFRTLQLKCVEDQDHMKLSTRSWIMETTSAHRISSMIST